MMCEWVYVTGRVKVIQMAQKKKKNGKQHESLTLIEFIINFTELVDSNYLKSHKKLAFNKFN